MKTVIFEVSSEEEVKARFLRVWETGIPETAAHYSFVTPELMSKMLTEKTLHLLESLCGAGPLSVEQVARRAGQDVDEVRTERRYADRRFNRQSQRRQSHLPL